MRTTLNIDDDIMNKVMSYTGQKNRSEAVRIVLSSFIKDQKKKKILALRGQVDIEDDWDKLRELDTSPISLNSSANSLIRCSSGKSVNTQFNQTSFQLANH